MKKYIELEMELIVLQAQDIVTVSGEFDGEEDINGFFQLMMKRYLTLILCIFMAFAFTACGDGEEPNSSNSSQPSIEGDSGGDIELPEDKFD